MGVIYEYRNTGIYFHHSRDEKPAPDEFSMHAHEMMEIFCLISGDAQFLVEGNTYNLTAGDIMIMRPAETHKMLIKPDVPYERLAIHFSIQYIDRVCPGSSERLDAFFDRRLGMSNRYEAGDFLSDHIRSCLMSASGNCKMMKDPERYLAVNLLAVIEELDIAWEKRKSAEEQAPHQPDGTSRAIVEYINRNLFGELSVKKLSETFFISPAQLNRIFRKATGSAVWEYIVVKRLLEARRKIEAGEPATKVCYLCGFGDYSAFYRAYRSKFGISPKRDKKRDNRKNGLKKQENI